MAMAAETKVEQKATQRLRVRPDQNRPENSSENMTRR